MNIVLRQPLLQNKLMFLQCRPASFLILWIYIDRFDPDIQLKVGQGYLEDKPYTGHPRCTQCKYNRRNILIDGREMV